MTGLGPFWIEKVILLPMFSQKTGLVTPFPSKVLKALMAMSSGLPSLIDHMLPLLALKFDMLFAGPAWPAKVAGKDPSCVSIMTPQGLTVVPIKAVGPFSVLITSLPSQWFVR